MKKKVYNYINLNPGVSNNDVATALKMDGREALKYILELQKENYICICSPVALDINNNESTYYKTTGKPFLEDE